MTGSPKKRESIARKQYSCVFLSSWSFGGRGVADAMVGQASPVRGAFVRTQRSHCRRSWFVSRLRFPHFSPSPHPKLGGTGGTHSNPAYVYSTSFDVSRPSDLVLSAFLRTHPAHSRGGMGNRHSRSSSGVDLFLASTSVVPIFDPRRTTDVWYPFVPLLFFESSFTAGKEDRAESELGMGRASNGAGEFRVQVAFRPTHDKPLKIDDFELLKVIGKGSFGKVCFFSTSSPSLSLLPSRKANQSPSQTRR